jgi:hypothetical protein
MRIRFHINSRMFISNPYVIRVTHPECTSPENMRLGEFRKMLKTAKSQITDTGGYSNPEFEIIKSNITTNISLQKFWDAPSVQCHSYWVFTNELDALQFTLSVGENALKMHIWPTNVKYTITEYIEDTDETRK